MFSLRLRARVSAHSLLSHSMSMTMHMHIFVPILCASVCMCDRNYIRMHVYEYAHTRKYPEEQRALTHARTCTYQYKLPNSHTRAHTLIKTLMQSRALSIVSRWRSPRRCDNERRSPGRVSNSTDTHANHKTKQIT
jgi:hypothetical protein